MFEVKWEPKSMQYRVYADGKLVNYHYYVASFSENYRQKLEDDHNNGKVKP